MPEYETVSINGAKKLSEIMKLESKKSQQMMLGKLAIPTKPKTGSKTLKKQRNSGLMKEQLDTILQRSTQEELKKYSSKENKLNIKEEKLLQVLSYQNSSRFGNDVRKNLKFNYTREQLVKKSIDQIDNILYRIRNYLNNRGMNGIYEQMIRTSAMGYEKVVSEFYDIEGFSDMLFANPSFWDAFERWKIERKMPDIPPGMQLMYIVSTTTLLAHMKTKQLSEPPKSKPKTKDIQSKKVENDDSKPEKTILKAGIKL